MLAKLLSGSRKAGEPDAPPSFLAAVQHMVASGELDPADSEERFQELLLLAAPKSGSAARL